jgi:hypothetical protein
MALPTSQYYSLSRYLKRRRVVDETQDALIEESKELNAQQQLKLLSLETIADALETDIGTLTSAIEALPEGLSGLSSQQVQNVANMGAQVIDASDWLKLAGSLGTALVFFDSMQSDTNPQWTFAAGVGGFAFSPGFPPGMVLSQNGIGDGGSMVSKAYPTRLFTTNACLRGWLKYTCPGAPAAVLTVGFVAASGTDHFRLTSDTGIGGSGKWALEIKVADQEVIVPTTMNVTNGILIEYELELITDVLQLVRFRVRQSGGVWTPHIAVGYAGTLAAGNALRLKALISGYGPGTDTATICRMQVEGVAPDA